jgi:hypothetical protein
LKGRVNASDSDDIFKSMPDEVPIIESSDTALWLSDRSSTVELLARQVRTGNVRLNVIIDGGMR